MRKVWKTDDGREFDAERDAHAHEAKVEMEKMLASQMPSAEALVAVNYLIKNAFEFRCLLSYFDDAPPNSEPPYSECEDP